MKNRSRSRKTMARKPSHFGSNSQPSPGGSSVASFASIGSIGGSIGKPAAGSFAMLQGDEPASRPRTEGGGDEERQDVSQQHVRKIGDRTPQVDERAGCDAGRDAERGA